MEIHILRANRSVGKGTIREGLIEREKAGEGLFGENTVLNLDVGTAFRHYLNAAVAMIVAAVLKGLLLFCPVARPLLKAAVPGTWKSRLRWMHVVAVLRLLLFSVR